MSNEKPLNRRSFLSRIAVGGVAAGTMSLIAGPALAQVTDSDGGRYADPAGRGRGGGRSSGITDRDSGSRADPGGNGRGTGLNDRDANDPACTGRGRQRTGITDSDGGSQADPGGDGRGTGVSDSDSSDRYCNGRRGRSGGGGGGNITDSDSGAWTDPGSRGRGRGGSRTGLTDRDANDPSGYGRGRPRGGSLAEWGDDDYHVEFTVDPASKSAVVYILDGHVKDGVKVEAAKITDVKLTVVDPKLVKGVLDLRAC